MRRFKKPAVAFLAVTGLGQPDNPVLFAWKSTDGGITGTMTATLPTATFQGPFLQITQQTQSDAMVPIWGGGIGECQIQGGATLQASF